MERPVRDHPSLRKAAIATAMKLLRGRLDQPGPEERLWLAVIEHAVRDAYSPTCTPDTRRREASDWIESDHFEDVATAIGLNPRWARDKICRIAQASGSPPFRDDATASLCAEGPSPCSRAPLGRGVGMARPNSTQGE